MEIFKLFGTIGIKNKDANRAIDETTGKAKTAGGRILDTFKKTAVAVGAIFAGKSLFDFGKSAVEAAATAKAIQAQFESVFGELVPQATETVDKMAKNMGILPERLNPMFTKLSAKYKGLGASTEEAMNLAARGTTLAADAAAFYDKSLEETSSSLNSFINGNYEGGEAIGLFANETQLASWASEHLGVNWKELDEKGKQIARLQFAEAMQKAAGATGQASREADGFENVMGNLRASWEKFKALVGGPLLAPVVKGLQSATEWFQKAGEWVKKLQDKLRENGAIQSFSGAFSNIKSVIGSVVGGIADFVGNLLGVDKSKSSVDQVAEAIQKVGEFLEKATDFLKDFVEWLNSGKPSADAFKAVLVAIGIAFGAWKIASVITKLGSLGTMFTTLATTISTAIASIPIIGWITAVVAALVYFFTQTETGKKIWQDFMTFLGNLWDSIKAKAEGIWNGLVAFLSGLWNGIQSTANSVFTTVGQFFSSIWQSISSTATSIWNSIKSFLSGLWNGIKSTASNVFNGIKNTISNVFNGIKSTASSVWNGIKESISKAINGAKTAVSNAVNKLKSIMNFKWSLPQLKLPRITIRGKFSLNPPSWPTFGLSWHAKGGIMSSPTLFGFDGKNFHAGGEAGDEAILPLNEKTLRPIGQQIADSAGLNRHDTTVFFERIIELLEKLLEKSTDLYIDREKISRIIYDEFGIIARREA